MLKPPRLRAGDRVAVIAPASSFQSRGVRQGRGGESSGSGSSRCSTSSVFAQHAGYLIRRRPSVRARRFSRPGAIRRSGRSSPCAAATAACTCSHISTEQDLRQTPKAFIGYSDLTTVLTYLTTQLRHRVVPWADAGPAAGPRHRRLRPRLVRAALTSPSRLASCGAGRWRRSTRARQPGRCSGGTLAQLVASLGTPYAFSPPERLCAVSRGRRGAAVPTRSHADAAAAGRRAEVGVGGRARRVSATAMSRGGEPSAASGACRSAQGFQRSGGVWISIGPHSRPARDAAIRRARARCGERQPTSDHRRGWRRVTIHFIGVCGTAMATLAALLKQKGARRSGIGRERLSADEHVSRVGADSHAHRLQRRSHHQPIDMVVVGNAISRGNVELEAVLDRKMRYCSLPEAVREHFLWSSRSIVIAGTHGKTTTTSLTGWLLVHARPGSEHSRRRHRAQSRRWRIELSAGQGTRVRHRRRRVRQRVLRQDGEVSEVSSGHRRHQQRRVRSRRHLCRSRCRAAGVPPARQSGAAFRIAAAGRGFAGRGRAEESSP